MTEPQLGEKKELGKWELLELPGLLQGINLLESSDLIQPGELLQAKNVFYKKQRIVADNGYLPLGQVVRGDPQGTWQFFKTNGTQETMLVTTATLYKLSDDNLWEYVSNGTATTTTGTESAGSTDVQVASITGFANGEYIGIRLTDGTQHQAQINGVPAAGTINFLPAIPTGKSVANGAAVVEAVALSGSHDHQVHFETMPVVDWMIFTNGVDILKYYDGTECKNVPNTPGSGNFVARTIALYNGALFAGNVIENGTAYPMRVWRCEINDPTDWTTGVGKTAGYNDMLNNEDFVLQLENLGPYLMVYRERSIIRGEWVGSQIESYHYTDMIYGEGAVSSSSVVDMGDYHILCGRSNIYEYRGGFDLTTLGDKLFYLLYSVDADINIAQRYKLFAFFVEELNEVWIFYPTSGSEECNRLVRYELGNERFTIREFPVSFLGWGYYTRSTSLIWNDLEGSWLDQTWKWNSATVQTGAPTTLLCTPDGDEVLEYNYVATTDDGASISWVVETKDYMDLPYLMRFDEMQMLALGDGIQVSYSTDQGLNWTVLGTVNAGSVVRRHRLQKQFVGETMRFKFEGIAPASIGQVNILVCRESEY